MQQKSGTIPEKYRRDLKSEDFVLISKQNKDYMAIISSFQQKQALLLTKISEQQKKLECLQNEKQEYRIRCSELQIKLHHFQIIKTQLNKQYDLLRSSIQDSKKNEKKLIEQIARLKFKVETISEINQKQQRDFQNSKMIIDTMKQKNAKLNEQIMQSKIKIFSNMIQKPSRSQPKKQNRNALNNLSFSQQIEQKPKMRKCINNSRIY